MTRTLGLFLLCLALPLTGCAHRGQPDYLEPTMLKIRDGAQVIGTSLGGRDINCVSLGNGPELVVFIAGIHGSEPAGVPLAARLVEELKADPSRLQGRRVVLVMNANPDGLAERRRTNNHGIDLNRNFPAGNHTTTRDRHGEHPLSEPESKALYNLFKSLPRPGRVITLHQPIKCIDYDGPEATTLPLAQALAEASGLPVKKLGSRPGSLGSWLGVDQQIPTITVEFLKSDSDLSDEALWDKYGDMMLAAVTYPESP